MGTFRWDERYQVAQFEYDRNFVGRGLEPSPLMMPVREGRVYSFAGLNREEGERCICKHYAVWRTMISGCCGGIPTSRLST